MMRWLIRLTIGGAILALLAYLWSQMNSDLEDDDLDDDIPLEFEVPFESILPAGGDSALVAVSDADTGEGPGANYAAPVPADPARAKARAHQDVVEDDLTIIRGIGPVFQKRLQDVGIMTFRQLADSDPDKLTADGIEGVGVDLESWITQARELADPPKEQS